MSRRDLIALVVCVAVLGGLIWGGMTAWRAFWYESPCEKAQERVDDTLQALAMFGNDDLDLLAAYKVAADKRDELGCPS